MTRKKAERRCCSNERSNVHSVGDMRIITSDVLLGAAGALVMIGVPFILAVLKQWGWW